MTEFSNDACVIGLGYVGLPVFLASSRSGLSVLGLDTNSDLIQGLRAGRSHIEDLQRELDQVHRHVKPRLTSDFSSVSDARIIVICVPTPLRSDRSPDLSLVQSALDSIIPFLKRGHTVILESTVGPGTTEGMVRESLERGSGMTAGLDFFLAFSPERIDPGNRNYTLANTPKIVGGISDTCTRVAADFYSHFVEDMRLASRPREAETAKILENLYRHVNIAFINEFALACRALDVNVNEVIELAASKPFGFSAFWPGAGVGGHCIPVDPQYFDYIVRERTGLPLRFIEVANQVNEGMAGYVGRLTQDALNTLGKPLKGARVLIMGVAYKADVADIRETPAERVAQWLSGHGAIVTFHDPYVPVWDSVSVSSSHSVVNLADALTAADIVVVLQAHREYRAMQLSEEINAKTLAVSHAVFPMAAFRL
jgi:UDP-N-acetyl-D-glucosamine dehydrogenase